jgi:thiamine biosynthesis protein ThiS
MLLTLNGKLIETEACTLADLLRENVKPNIRVAVVLNEQVILSADYATKKLSANDDVELLIFAGGG